MCVTLLMKKNGKKKGGVWGGGVGVEFDGLQSLNLVLPLISSRSYSGYLIYEQVIWTTHAWIFILYIKKGPNLPPKQEA